MARKEANRCSTPLRRGIALTNEVAQKAAKREEELQQLAVVCPSLWQPSVVASQRNHAFVGSIGRRQSQDGTATKAPKASRLGVSAVTGSNGEVRSTRGSLRPLPQAQLPSARQSHDSGSPIPVRPTSAAPQRPRRASVSVPISSPSSSRPSCQRPSSGNVFHRRAAAAAKSWSGQSGDEPISADSEGSTAAKPSFGSWTLQERCATQAWFSSSDDGGTTALTAPDFQVGTKAPCLHSPPAPREEKCAKPTSLALHRKTLVTVICSKPEIITQSVQKRRSLIVNGSKWCSNQRREQIAIEPHLQVQSEEDDGSPLLRYGRDDLSPMSSVSSLGSNCVPGYANQRVELDQAEVFARLEIEAAAADHLRAKACSEANHLLRLPDIIDA